MEDEKYVKPVKKKHRKRRLLSTVLSAAMVSGLLAGAMPSGSFMGPREVFAEGNDERAEADAKPAVIAQSADLKYLDRVTLKEGAVSKYGQQEVTFVDEKGLPVSLEQRAEEVSGISGEEMTAGLYSARSSSSNKDDMPQVRNQGTWGLCWAFASTAALEANILMTDSGCSSVSKDKTLLDFSERHMGWFAHHTLSSLKGDPTKGLDGVKKGSAKAAYTGGNYYQSTAYLARGSGLALEEDVPYSNSMGTVPEADRYDSVVTLRNSYTVSYDISTDEKAASSIEAVKLLVDTYGAAGCSYKSVDAYYNKTANGTAYYQRAGGTNHAVCIVGYDDNFAVSNFNAGMQPEKPGAWLIRNSWGDWWGDDGYFWLSYYDGSLSGIFAYEAADSADYGDIYQYDAAGSYSYMGVNATANVFQARRDDTLKSVGFYTHSAVAGGTIEVYTNDEKMKNPADGTKVTTCSLDPIPYAGYHVVDLGSTVNVTEKQYFSVILTLNDPGSTAMYSFEGKKGCKSSAGQSYYLHYGQWNDCYKIAGNTCIKALMAGETDASDLDGLLADAKAVTADMVADTGGDALYNWIQKEVKAAQCAKDTAASDDVARAVKRLAEVLSHTGSRKIYADTAKTKGPGNGGVSMYLNGGSYKKNGVTTKYGAQTFTFSVDKVMSWKPKGNMLVSAYYGNYVAAATTTKNMPALDSSGKVVNPDTDAAAIVKVKLSGSKVSITPLAEGTVYVWVLYFPKGGKCYPTDEDDYAVTKVTVGTAAPTTVKLYNTQDKAQNCTDTTIPQYLSTVMPEGGSASVYVTGTSGNRTKKLDTLAASQLDGTNYEPVVPVKYKDWIDVTRDANEANKITFTAKEGILDQFKVKKNKTLAVTIPVYCIRNSKKANFKLVIGNPVKEMSFTAGEGAELTENGDILDVKLDDAKLKTSTGMIVEEKTMYLAADKRDCTDSTAVLRMAEEDDIIFNTSNVLSVSTKLSAEQKKVTMALQKDKKTYKITAKKGTAAGTTVYFVVRHNAYIHQSGSGYQIIKVTVGDAAS